jgi:hypothetical protein
VRAPLVWRWRHEAELVSVLRRCAAWEAEWARMRVERDEAVEVAEGLAVEMRHAAPAARRERDAMAARAKSYADRNLRQAVKIERLEHELAEARGEVDATTWGYPAARDENEGAA